VGTEEKTYNLSAKYSNFNYSCSIKSN